MIKFFLTLKKLKLGQVGENQYRGSLGLLPIDQSKNNNPLFESFIGASSEGWT